MAGRGLAPAASAASGPAEGEDRLDRRQAGGRAVGHPDRARRAAALDSGPCRDRDDEHPSRRLLHVPAERQPAREEGLHVRRRARSSTTGGSAACSSPAPPCRPRVTGRRARGVPEGASCDRTAADRGREPRAPASYLALAFPREFETTGEIASRIGTQVVYDLPPDAWDTFVPNVLATGPAAMTGAAKQTIDPGRIAIVVVGDRRTVERPSVPRLPARSASCRWTTSSDLRPSIAP